MAVYVDTLFPVRAFKPMAWRWAFACHMWADSLEELHEFAARLGLRRGWFQNHPRVPHYDLSPGKRERALVLGASEGNLRELFRNLRAAKDSRL